MASRRASVSTSTVGLEAWFPVPGSAGEDEPELRLLRERLRGWLTHFEPVVILSQRLLVWERPLHSIIAALALNTLFWLLSSSSLRPLFLLSVFLIGLTLLERWKDKLPQIAVGYPEVTAVEREAQPDEPRLLSVEELSHHLAEILHYDMLRMFRAGRCWTLHSRDNDHLYHTLSVSSVLSVLLWPLVVYHELIQKMYTRLEPILMKLDYSMKGDTQRHKKKLKKEQEEGDEPRAETESESEEELSCFAPTVDVKTTALAMAITDSELSDEEASILESGGFSVSRATTPQLIDVSEADPDQQSLHSEPEESFTRDLAEFPSVDELPSIEPGLFHFPLGVFGSEHTPSEEEEALTPASLLIQHLASPLHFVNTHFNGYGQAVGAPNQSIVGTEGTPDGNSRPARSLEALSEEIVSTAISTVVQNTLSALLRSTEASEGSSMASFLPTETPPCPLESPLDLLPTHEETDREENDVDLTETSTEDQPDVTLVPAEEEDFELLDQSELEQMDEGLDLGGDEQEVGRASANMPPSCQQLAEPKDS
ncbi:hypothetical protein DNTS_032254 [Danionella cerebrum]|uniref:RETREG1-3/ARL6IP-like N-terminal reticulon-homology domain-containing protein n=1 Tax=Danionella cerebrum TaxID=2873325 RepID=A0A553RDD6_9TELE|nr:hypothetical protein DNTS_032254 [Danionella translucida]